MITVINDSRNSDGNKERTASLMRFKQDEFTNAWATLSIEQGSDQEIRIRFDRTPEDLLFFDQFRAELDKIGHWLREETE